MDALEVEGLGKTYPKGTEALKDISFKIAKGSIFCLLGRNGAGKTTLLRILATQLKFTVGKAKVLGFDVAKEPDKIRERISVVPQEARPFMMLSPYDHIYYMCKIRGMGTYDAKRRTEEIMKELELWEHRKKLTADLSGGLRQRVIVGLALVTTPELIFLDEPSIGLDPLGRRVIWNMIRKMTKKGTTVLLTTHYMDEADALADKLLIIDKGRKVFFGTVDEAKHAAGTETKVILERPGNTTHDREVLVPKNDQEIIEIIQRGLKDGRHVTFKPPSLDEAFIHFVGGSIEEETA
jgi:ABC-2 type transport system ATP-binding protein